MNTATDIELMQQIGEGSETALREVIERHRERLYRLAYRLLNDHDSASDAVQETFIRLWKHASRFDPSHSLISWLCIICARKCYDELRLRRRHRETIAEMPVDISQPDTMATEEILKLLHCAIADLPPKQRVIYQLREIECLSTEEVANATRMSTDQVKANLCIARNKVRETLKRYGI